MLFFPCGGKLKIHFGTPKSPGNGGSRLSFPSQENASEQLRTANAGKTFLFNRQFKNTRNLPFPTGKNHDTKACEFSF